MQIGSPPTSYFGGRPVTASDAPGTGTSEILNQTGPKFIQAYADVVLNTARQAGVLAEKNITVGLFGAALALVILAFGFKLDWFPGTLEPVEFIAVLAFSFAMIMTATAFRFYIYRARTEARISERRLAEKFIDAASMTYERAHTIIDKAHETNEDVV